jgi:hypothetical protein
MTLLNPDEISRIYSERIFEIAGTTRRKRKIVCPLPRHNHQNYTPSFSIFWADNRWRWRCHGSCNLKGDVIDLVGYINVPNYDPKDPRMLSRAISVLAGNNFEPSAPEPPKQRAARLTPDRWRDFYPPGPEVVEYAEKRGISRKTLEQFRVGQREFTNPQITWMTMPAFEDGTLTGIKMRNIGNTSSKDRYRSVGGSVKGLFNYDGVAYKSEKIYVVKGEIAAMVMVENGLLACAPTGGESQKVTEKMKKALALGDVVVIGDNDPDPEVRKDTRQHAKRRAKNLSAKLFFPPNDYKDVDDWILNDPLAVNKLKGL